MRMRKSRKGEMSGLRSPRGDQTAPGVSYGRRSRLGHMSGKFDICFLHSLRISWRSPVYFYPALLEKTGRKGGSDR